MVQSQPESSSSDGDEDGAPVLTGATAAALREFLAEAEAARAKAAARGDDNDVEALFSEDWGLSQFWYTDETAEAAASAVIKASQARVDLVCDKEEEEERTRGGTAGAAAAAAPPTSTLTEVPSPRPPRRRRLPRIACIACPSLFRALRASPEFREGADAHLFEFDDRFAKLGGGFSHYDYRKPKEVEEGLLGTFDAVVADPPYLSAECLKKTAVTMRLLGAGGLAVGKREKGEKAEAGGSGGTDGEERGAPSSLAPPPPVLVLLSGAVQRHRAAAYLGLVPVKWRPQHRNKLGNEFLLMTSSEGVARELGGFDEELPIDPVEDEVKSDSDSDVKGEGEDRKEEGKEGEKQEGL